MMNTKPFLPFLLAFISYPALAQVLTCSTERNNDNSLSIYADNQSHANYTVKLMFSNTMGYSDGRMGSISPIVLATTLYGRREIFKAGMISGGVTHSFQYKYQYFPGKAMDKAPDTSFAYLMPAHHGKSLRVSMVTSVAQTIGHKEPDGYYYGTGFVFALGDTICAARTGVVYNCNDQIKEGEKQQDFYKSDRNKIQVENRDGSLSTYDILAPIKLLVQAGDQVYAGMPLAIFTKESDKYIVMLSSCYLNKKLLMAPFDESNPEIHSCRTYYHMHFYTTEKETPSLLEINKQYNVEHPSTLLTAEFTKKEMKKLLP